MTPVLRIPSSLLEEIRSDLRRPHDHAWERVGFLRVRLTESARGPLLLAASYEPVPDGDYLRASDVGARIGIAAIRRALGWAASGDGVFHVHEHAGCGCPRLSSVDREGLKGLMPALCAVGQQSMHGALLLSTDAGGAAAWSFAATDSMALDVSVIGNPIAFWRGDIR